MEIEFTDAAKDVIGKEGYQPEFGARPLRRAIQNQIEDRLSEALLSGKFESGDTIVVDAEEGQVVLRDVKGEKRSEPSEETAAPA